MLSHELISRYGALIVFLNVLGSSLGLPLPAIPTLITIGASIAISTHAISSTLANFSIMLTAAVVGGSIGDFVWFQGGKRYGERTLQTICKLSMSRETCVRKTERFFGRWGVRVMIVARFLPGLSLVSVPLCGAMAVRLRVFISYDCIGICLWAFVGLTMGALFSAQIDLIFRIFSQLGWQALVVVAVGLVSYILYRYLRRILLARALETARITAGELHVLQSCDPRPVVFDIRSHERRILDPFVIPGSIYVDERRAYEIVNEFGTRRTMVIYCSCPGEVSAAWMAKRLRGAGVQTALPLTGGIDAWRAAGFSVDPIEAIYSTYIAAETRGMAG
ncbi:VTT domain-containing protein [Paraburkholderia nodosa]|uniref:VTT domain-containing protein n=1 Tax=Paraburkholderia nodosa TaxID=392320 RepID=UPI000ACD5A49|nr:VTT domain-containing protein [Paraburkholderia nodosa]